MEKPQHTKELDDSYATTTRTREGIAAPVIHFPQHGTSPWQEFWEKHQPRGEAVSLSSLRKRKRMEKYV